MVFKSRLNNREIRSIVKDYRQALENDNFNVEKIILFGSYAKKSIKDWSDLDLLVVSSNFGHKNSFDEQVEANIIAKKISPLIEVHPISVKEFNQPISSWVIEAKRYGQELI